MSQTGHGRKFYDTARRSSYALGRRGPSLPFLTLADDGEPDLPLAKIGLWLLIGASVYALLALVGIGLGTLIEMALEAVP